MNLLDGLFKIFPNLKKITEDVSVKFFSDNKKEVIYNDNRSININIGKLTPKKEKDLKQLLNQSLSKDNLTILDIKSRKLLDEFTETESLNQDLLDFFKNKIPTGDLRILRASLFLKSQFEKGEPVGKLKQDLVEKYGDRGKNICNLCSAGYFETLIEPLYEQMEKQPDFSEEKFLERYNTVINHFPFAIFVNRNMRQDEIKTKVIKQIKINKQYGIKHLTLHGIGSDNVSSISKVLLDKDLAQYFTALPNIESGQNFITAKISF